MIQIIKEDKEVRYSVNIVFKTISIVVKVFGIIVFKKVTKII